MSQVVFLCPFRGQQWCPRIMDKRRAEGGLTGPRSLGCEGDTWPQTQGQRLHRTTSLLPGALEMLCLA